jgi:hypothetical protein
VFRNCLNFNESVHGPETMHPARWSGVRSSRIAAPVYRFVGASDLSEDRSAFFAYAALRFVPILQDYVSAALVPERWFQPVLPVRREAG